MSTTAATSVISTLIEVTPEIVQGDLERQDLCVLASRVGQDALAYFGVAATPVTTRTIAFNQAWFEFANAHDGNLDDPAWADQPADCWSVAVDERHEHDGRFPGHVVLVTDDAMVDLSLGQFSRPDHGMEFPVAGALPLAGFMGGEPLQWTTLDPPSYVIYQLRKDAPSFRHGSDWRRGGGAYTGKVIREMKARLA